MEADLVLLGASFRHEKRSLGPSLALGSLGNGSLNFWTHPRADQSEILKQETDAAFAPKHAEPDLIDETLDLETPGFPRRAFEWDGATRSDTNTPRKIRAFNPASDTNQVQWAKRWLSVDQRKLLVEIVDWSTLRRGWTPCHRRDGWPARQT